MEAGQFEQAIQRYQFALTIDPESLPDCLEVVARTEDGVIMGLRHRELAVHGVQFHPESIASEHGHAILRNFLKLADAYTRPETTEDHG